MSDTDSESQSRADKEKHAYSTTGPTYYDATFATDQRYWTGVTPTYDSSSAGQFTLTGSSQLFANTGGTQTIPLIDIPARRQIDQIGNHIFIIESRIGRVEERLNDLEIVRPRVVTLREIDEPTAEREIVDYLKAHGEADTAELVENLGIDIDIVLVLLQDDYPTFSA